MFHKIRGLAGCSTVHGKGCGEKSVGGCMRPLACMVRGYRGSRGYRGWGRVGVRLRVRLVVRVRARVRVGP